MIAKSVVIYFFLLILISFAIEVGATDINIDITYNNQKKSWQATYSTHHDLLKIELNNGRVLELTGGVREYKIEKNSKLDYQGYPYIVRFDDQRTLLNLEPILPKVAYTKKMSFLPKYLLFYTNTSKRLSQPNYYLISHSIPYAKVKRYELEMDFSFSEDFKIVFKENLDLLLGYYERKFGQKYFRDLKIHVIKDKSERSFVEGHVRGNVMILIINERLMPTSKNVLLTLSHELSHFIFSSYENSTPKWITEGIPEILALQSLFDNKYISYEEYLNTISDNVNRCNLNLSSESINSIGNDSISLNYECGMIVGFLISESSKPGNPVSFWKDFLIYYPNFNEGEIYKAISDMSKDGSSKLATIKLFLNDADRDRRIRLINDLLAKSKSRLHLIEDNSYEYNKFNGLTLLAALMTQQCNEFSFIPKDDKALLDSDRPCGLLSKLKYVDKIENLSLMEFGSEIYDLVEMKCNNGSSIRISGNDEVNIMCTKLSNSRSKNYKLNTIY